MRPCASTVKTFAPNQVLCAVGHGDLGRDMALPPSWKAPCLCLNVSTQMSGVWSRGGFLWETMLFSEWGSMALPGVSAEVGLFIFPSDKFTFPGLINTPQIGYLVVVVQSLSPVLLFVTPWTAARRLPCPALSPGACSNSCLLSF